LEECLADLEWLPAKGYILIITEAYHVLPDDEEEFETFLEILRDAGEAWGHGQAGMSAQRATPFHVLFAVSEHEKSKRAHWGMKEINAEPTRGPNTQQRSPSADLRTASRQDRLVIKMIRARNGNVCLGRSTRRCVYPTLRIYGRIFLVTFSKPVQRKSTEDNPLTDSVCAAV
jgi:barstar (barnase inhibitor)